MPVFTFAEQLAAGDSNTNIMTGSKFEFLSRPSVVRVFAVTDAADTAQLDLSLGNVVVGEDLNVPRVADTTGPNRNEHLILQGAGVGQDRIQIRVVNTNGAAVCDYRALVEIVELA